MQNEDMSVPGENPFNPSLHSLSPKAGTAAPTTGTTVEAGQGGPPTGVAMIRRRAVPVQAFKALGSEVRWQILQMLGDGLEHSASEIAAILKRDIDGVAKHLRLMRSAGVIMSQKGEDRRFEMYRLRREALGADGSLDLGTVLIRNVRE